MLFMALWFLALLGCFGLESFDMPNSLARLLAPPLSVLVLSLMLVQSLSAEDRQSESYKHTTAQ